MPLPTFQFTTPMNQPGGGADAGMQQYIQQGQSAISPGQAQVAQSSPLQAGGAADLAKALASLQQTPPPGTQLPADVSQAAMGAGAAMNPNSPSGENMGGVGPTQNNLALAQGLQNAVQNPGQVQGVPAMQNYQNFLSGGGYGG